MNHQILILRASCAVNNRMDPYNRIFNFLKMQVPWLQYQVNSSSNHILKRILRNSVEKILYKINLLKCNNSLNKYNKFINNSICYHYNKLQWILEINLALKRKKLIFLPKNPSMKKQKLKRSYISRL